MKDKWVKAGVTIGPEGRTITYRAPDTGVRIESRKVEVPHANRVGTWKHTSYWVIWPDGSETQFWRLADAKAAAENI
jgi:hypothetical protein